MKTMLLALFAILVPALAMAHPSILPHEHPHSASMLPDLTALLMAAVAVGAGMLVIAMSKRARK